MFKVLIIYVCKLHTRAVATQETWSYDGDGRPSRNEMINYSYSVEFVRNGDDDGGDCIGLSVAKKFINGFGVFEFRARSRPGVGHHRIKEPKVQNFPVKSQQFAICIE